MNEHREQTAELFENRIDYVDLSAFGVKKGHHYSPIEHEGYTVESIERIRNQ